MAPRSCPLLLPQISGERKGHSVTLKADHVSGAGHELEAEIEEAHILNSHGYKLPWALPWFLQNLMSLHYHSAYAVPIWHKYPDFAVPEDNNFPPGQVC